MASLFRPFSSFCFVSLALSLSLSLVFTISHVEIAKLRETPFILFNLKIVWCSTEPLMNLRLEVSNCRYRSQLTLKYHHWGPLKTNSAAVVQVELEELEKSEFGNKGPKDLQMIFSIP